jgi:hypothetical protein
MLSECVIFDNSDLMDMLCDIYYGSYMYVIGLDNFMVCVRLPFYVVYPLPILNVP